jgi:ferritin-like metal-binding protein YciE
MAKKPKLLSDLFHDTLKDVYFAEKKIYATLPKMAKAAQDKKLQVAFLKHQKETAGQIKRLEPCSRFSARNLPPRSVKPSWASPQRALRS